MGCGNCSTGNGVPNGCKSNGACGVGGCGKLSVYDWLADVELPAGQSTYDIVEVRFKNSRKAFFRNMKGFQLQVSDVVVVETSPGHDIGVVSVVGELARIQVRKKAPNFKPHEARKIHRKATKEDIEKWQKARTREEETMLASRKLASELALNMKISDVEYQGDGSKATFYYTAEDRIDFRQLIRDLADEFKVRIEMKQIGVRQEAARLGGIGSCGRELCCSTWLTDFRSVSTAAARYQQLSLNPQKLAGQCGKLKCCLNYELDSYLDALKKFPSADVKLQTEKGVAFHVKTDVFKGQMWYLQEYRGEDSGPSIFVPLSPEDVKEIIEMNKAGKKPVDLKSYMVEVEVAEPDYTNVVGQDSLNRFDSAFKKKKKKKKGRGGNQRPDSANAASGKQEAGAGGGQQQKGGSGQQRQQGQGKGGQQSQGQRQNNNKPKPQGQGGNKPQQAKGGQQNKPKPQQQGQQQKRQEPAAGGGENPKQQNRPQGQQAAGEGQKKNNKRRNKNRNNRNKNNDGQAKPNTPEQGS
jgi:cell fate regulator YaaT (PSP1 superfamily)